MIDKIINFDNWLTSIIPFDLITFRLLGDAAYLLLIQLEIWKGRLQEIQLNNST